MSVNRILLTKFRYTITKVKRSRNEWCIVSNVIGELKNNIAYMIIGLIGFKRVGKSTAAKYLNEKYGFIRHNMKDGLIAEMKERLPDTLRELGVIYNMTTDELFDEKPPAMRALMVNYGTEVRRKDDPDYWVKEYIDEVEYLATLGEYNIVTDDVRFLNEAATVKEVKSGGILIRLTRSDILTGGDHASETEQLEIVADYTIYAEPGGEDAVYKELDRIMADVLK